MSEVPLTFNNGQTATTSEIVAVQDRGKKKQGVDRNKSYIVTNLVKDGVDKNNRPLYKREIFSFKSACDAKNFNSKIESGAFKDGKQASAQSGGTLIASGST